MTLLRLLCCILFITIKTTSAFAVTFIEDSKQLGKNAFQISTAPRHWTAKSWLGAGLIGSSAYLLYKNKENDRSFFKPNRLNQKTNEYEIYPKTIFEKSYFNLIKLPLSSIFYATAGSYIFGQLTGAKPIRNASFELLQSMGISSALAVLGAYVFAEQRPAEGGNLRHFEWGGHGVSGHSTFYASLSGPLNKYLTTIQKDDSWQLKTMKYIGKGFIYGIPLMVGYSRLRHEFSHNYVTERAEPSHHAWNVLLGLSLGYAVGEFIARNNWLSPAS